jgi:hypothetical protein
MTRWWASCPKLNLRAPKGPAPTLRLSYPVRETDVPHPGLSGPDPQASLPRRKAGTTPAVWESQIVGRVARISARVSQVAG